MRTNKYLIRWSANNGSTFSSFESNNKKQAIKNAREIVRGNLFPGNSGNFTIYDKRDNNSPIETKTINRN
jgi:hypothetical protein